MFDYTFYRSPLWDTVCEEVRTICHEVLNNGEFWWAWPCWDAWPTVRTFWNTRRVWL